MDRWERKGERAGTKNSGGKTGQRENTILISGELLRLVYTFFSSDAVHLVLKQRRNDFPFN